MASLPLLAGISYVHFAEIGVGHLVKLLFEVCQVGLNIVSNREFAQVVGSRLNKSKGTGGSLRQRYHVVHVLFESGPLFMGSRTVLACFTILEARKRGQVPSGTVEIALIHGVGDPRHGVSIDV